MQDSKELVRLKALKERLLARYLKLQDEADRTNEKIYGICCDIEKANLEIQREEAKQASQQQARATSG